MLRGVLTFALMTCCAYLQAAPLDGQVSAIINKGRSAQAQWGIQAVDLKSGRTLADVGGSKLMVPASNRKLVSTAMACTYFDPAYKFETTLTVDHIGPDGTVTDLIINASGDPTWTSEFLQRPGQFVLTRLASQAAEAGIRHVTGHLVIDISRFESRTFIPEVWTWHDFQTTDGAFPAPLNINKNFGTITVTPQRAGEQLDVTTPYGLMPFEIANQSMTVKTAGVRTLQVVRSLDGRTLTVSGSLGRDVKPIGLAYALGDPVNYAGNEMLAALEKAGITVDGGFQVSSEKPTATKVVGTFTSVEMAKIVKLTNQESDNFLAENLYLAVGGKLFGKVSYNSSQGAEKGFWKKLGVSEADYNGEDGSGLGRKNTITPAALTKLLIAMHGNEMFVSSLPESGKSGTLKYRLSDKAMAKRVEAKTGTLDGVSALSGYVTASSGRVIAFSVMANNFTCGKGTIRAAIDDIVELLAQQ